MNTTKKYAHRCDTCRISLAKRHQKKYKNFEKNFIYLYSQITYLSNKKN